MAYARTCFDNRHTGITHHRLNQAGTAARNNHGGFPRLDYDVIDVSLDRSANVFAEHMVHAPFVRRTRIPQTKQHGDIAVHAERCDERSHELVGLFHLDLVIP